MANTMSRIGGQQGFGAQQGLGNQSSSEAVRHSEGPVAATIEEYTAQIPSDVYLWAAGASILGSLTLKAAGRDHGALFVGQWVAPFLILGLYNKLVKVAGTDRVGTNGSHA